MLNGRHDLNQILSSAGLTAIEAVAAHARFLSLRALQECGLSHIIAAKRVSLRGDREAKKRTVSTCKTFYWDDNQVPVDIFLKIANIPKPPEGQFNHVVSDPLNPALYANPRNIVWTPRFLGYLTDEDERVKRALEFRSYEIYGQWLRQPIDKPEDYPSNWVEPLDPEPGVEGRFRAYFGSSPNSTTAKSARDCGWYFSDWRPDQTVPLSRTKRSVKG